MTRFAPRATTDLRLPPDLAIARPAPQRPEPARQPSDERRWRRVIVARLLLADTTAAVLAVAIGWAVRIGFHNLANARGYLVWSLVVAAVWVGSLHMQGAYDVRLVANGTRDYQRVIRAGAMLAGAVAIVCYLSGDLLGRTFVALVIPTGAVLMLVARFGLRRTLHRRRRHGGWSSTILAVGTRESVSHLTELTQRIPEAGLTVVGACVEDASPGDEIARGVPVVGAVAEAALVAEKLDVDVVAVAGSGLGPRRIRELGWQLEGTRRSLVMAPGLTEVAGPRVHVSPVHGLPLMWVDQPQFTGGTRVVKRAVDVLVSGAAIVVCAPLLLLLALAVKLTSPGSVIYRSTRNGKGGQTFTVFKFRSMYQGADQVRDDLLELSHHGDSVLFKIRQDPRVTPVGRFLRKWSLDELPQLFNIFTGSMSLVGPRPPLPGEVERYESDAHRRLLVKPGLTGLWQVSGRSDLSWEESVRLDLYYVENWSLAFDFAIIARTVLAVLQRRGAY